MLTLQYEGKEYLNWDEQSLLYVGVPKKVIDAAKKAGGR